MEQQQFPYEALKEKFCQVSAFLILYIVDRLEIKQKNRKTYFYMQQYPLSDASNLINKIFRSITYVVLNCQY